MVMAKVPFQRTSQSDSFSDPRILKLEIGKTMEKTWMRRKEVKEVGKEVGHVVSPL